MTSCFVLAAPARKNTCPRGRPTRPLVVRCTLPVRMHGVQGISFFCLLSPTWSTDPPIMKKMHTLWRESPALKNHDWITNLTHAAAAGGKVFFLGAAPEEKMKEANELSRRQSNYASASAGSRRRCTIALCDRGYFSSLPRMYI